MAEFERPVTRALEGALIRVTDDDISAANQLSLHCPICASPVERNAPTAELAAVACGECHTLYHHACWPQNGGQCAMLGCSHTRCYPYGERVDPLLVISVRDLPREGRGFSRNGLNERLKAQQRELQRERSGGIWQTLWRRLLAAIRIGV